MKSFKERLANDELIRVFALGRIFHPVVIDLYGLAGGFHGFWLDAEHIGFSTEQLIAASLAARANGFDSFVRMAPIGYWHVTQCLETGIGGVMGAQIQSADHAREFVRSAKYPPLGNRGLNLGGRDGDYYAKPAAQLVEEANRDRLVAIQIETIGALEDADAIAALEGVDLLFIGPADLSLALGVVGQFHHDKLWEAIEHVAAVSHQHGKAWGAVVPDPKFADRAMDNGCRMPTFGNDCLALRRGIDAFKSAFANQFEGG